MRVQALILSQFNDKKGFAIIHVVPKDGIITEKQFSIYSELILHREQLCGKLLVLEFMNKYYLVGVPLISKSLNENFVYKRAKFIYSVNILVSKRSYLNQNIQPTYKQIAKKLGHFFKFIQETTHFIYNNSQYRAYLSKILDKCLRDINNKTQCVMNHLASCYTILSFRCPPLFNQQKQIVKLKQQSVPVTFLSASQIQGQIQNQFCQGLMHIARIGDYNLKKISGLMGHQKHIYKFYNKAIDMGLVKIVDMFCIFNRYSLTPRIHEYLPNKRYYGNLDKICKAITLKKIKEQQQISPGQLLKIYFQFHRNSTLKKIIDNNIDIVSRMNFVKFIRISYVLGIIKRIHERVAFISEQNQYFQFIRDDNLCLLQGVSGQYKSRYNIELVNHIKNMNSVEQICVDLNIDRVKLFKILKKHGQGKIRFFYTQQ